MKRFVTFGAIFIFAAGILVVMAATADAQTKTAYRGAHSCDAMQVEVTFNYDPAAKQITEFAAHHHCAAGREYIDWKVDEPIPVEDGRFFYQDNYAHTISGSIDADGKMAGEFSKYAFGLPCADNKTHDLCTEWEASPVQ